MLKLLVASALVAACAGSTPPPASPTTTTTPAAAAKPFAMRSYLLVMLRRGTTWTPEKTDETKRIFEGHMANIKAMSRAGKLVIAGPFDAPETDRAAYAGLYIFDVATREELDTLLADDPAVKSGRLTPEVLTWYGPAGLTYDGREESLR